MFKVAVRPRDIIAAGTDGLFDNLPTEVIEFIVNAEREKVYTNTKLLRYYLIAPTKLP